jgi:hypothetical protein
MNNQAEAAGQANHQPDSENLNEGVSARSSSINGLGVFASRSSRQGEFILLIDDSRVVTPELPFLPGEGQRHCDYLEGGKVVLKRFR